MSLSGKRIVITGGATGIGLATTRLAVERGAQVVITGRTEATLKAAAESVGPGVEYRVLDVTDPEAVERVLAAVGPFDHLVTGAAEIVAGPFVELPEADARSLFETKFWGQYRAAKAAVAHIAPDGSILFFSGYLYRKAEAGFSGFAAVNGAVEGLVKALAIELAPLRVNAISPGQIDVFEGRWDAESHAKYRADVSAALPAGRPGTPEEAAHAVLYLLENTFTTGTTLDVDGGK
ncbi:SDR family oxidoreductase [Phytomonospora sp. NPDC050363]|uniref:SDR family oxidoreductase n=1 Tax=Phytomonospora sp. NPDC050363 TaxID=3155642 RepID=UPI0033E341C1